MVFFSQVLALQKLNSGPVKIPTVSAEHRNDIFENDVVLDYSFKKTL